MVLGLNQFAGLYDDVPREMNDNKNAASSSHGADGTLNKAEEPSVRTLKKCFFPQKEDSGMLTIFANKPGGITKELLCTKSNLMKAGNDGSNSRRLARTEQRTQQHTPKKEDTKKDA